MNYQNNLLVNFLIIRNYFTVLLEITYKELALLLINNEIIIIEIKNINHMNPDLNNHQINIRHKPAIKISKNMSVIFNIYNFYKYNMNILASKKI